MASARPSSQRENKNPSEHVFDGFFYFFKYIPIQSDNTLIESFGIDKTKLRNNRTRFPFTNKTQSDMIFIAFH